MRVAILTLVALYILMVLTVGVKCTEYDLFTLFHRHIPVFWALIITLLTGWFDVILAIILKVLTLCGIVF